ncbi:hypothetical protein CEP52_000443 [Fusarium oligoseptatum]|uniref:Uncharacterized protein n=1 Tax=Fusarium oligoseptatum TaxID=2604345 RepID=A0A428UP64_9HYPO|nr:hypothetical protein CEP52_000443 [Fusarium oligoseptatum]
MARIHPQPEDKHCIKKRPGQASQTKTRRSQFTWGHNNIAGLKEDRQARARTGLSSAYGIHNQWIHCEGQDTERQELKSTVLSMLPPPSGLDPGDRTTHPQKIQATPEGCKKVGPGFWSGFKGHTTDHRQDRHHTHMGERPSTDGTSSTYLVHCRGAPDRARSTRLRGPTLDLALPPMGDGAWPWHTLYWGMPRDPRVSEDGPPPRESAVRTPTTRDYTPEARRRETRPKML